MVNSEREITPFAIELLVHVTMSLRRRVEKSGREDTIPRKLFKKEYLKLCTSKNFPIHPKFSSLFLISLGTCTHTSIPKIWLAHAPILLLLLLCLLCLVTWKCQRTCIVKWLCEFGPPISHLEKPQKVHCDMVMRIWRYLKSQCSIGTCLQTKWKHQN
jgi:hypothetical protein